MARRVALYAVVLVTMLVTMLGTMTVLPGRTLLAHHAFAAEFDGKKPLTLKGTVTKVELINPHSWLHIAVKDPATSTVTAWRIEMGAPNQLLRRGWNKNSLPIGTEVIVHGYAARNGSKTANGGTITFGDGRKITVSSSGTGAPGTK